MKIASSLAVLALALASIASSCGGSPPPASHTETSEPTRPVRIAASDPTTDDGADAPRPVRVEPTLPGEVPLSDDLADPPPVEPPAP